MLDAQGIERIFDAGEEAAAHDRAFAVDNEYALKAHFGG